MKLSRRTFITSGAVALGLSAAARIGYVAGSSGLPSNLSSAQSLESNLPAASFAASAPSAASVLASAAPASAAQNQPKSLVVVQLAGGNDGLATVLPYHDPSLVSNRPSLAFGADQVVALNDTVALHPNLKALKPLYDQGKLAVIQGVGYPNPNRSHFEAMDIWATASPDKPMTTGWLGRYLDAANLATSNPFNAVNVGSATPFALKTQKVAVPSIQSAEAFTLRANPRQPQDTQALMAAFNAIYQRGPGGVPYYGVVDGVEANTVAAAASLKDLATKYHSSVNYPQTALGKSLQQVAELMTGGFGTRVFYASTGGFDTHAGEKPQHDRLMSELADAVAAFYQDLQQHGLSQNTVLMTWSEFGRRVKENGSGGTDHGTAAPMFVLGDAVKGGVVGDQPSLSKLDTNGDLNFGIDFRAVYNTLLTNWLGMDGQEVLGAHFETLPLFK
ncbi:MAG TPA: DUF1501 domain-containing protein [Chloroflexota bacterium]|nr:DUF1501 domain-containing protein [Chloroflexota bacterium]